MSLKNLDADLDNYISSSKQEDDLFENVYLDAPEPLAPKSDVDKLRATEDRPNYRKRRFDDSKFKNRSNQRQNFPKIDPQMPAMKFDVTFNKEDSVEELGSQMSAALNETKSDLIIKCIKIAGVEKCLELYNATETVEKHGGMLTLDKRRRRTPGGVFLQLLRDDKNLTDDMKTELFAEEKKNYRKIEHARRKAKRRHNFDELLHGFKAKLGEKELPCKKDVFVDEALDAKSEMCEEGEVLSNDETSMQ